jgi:hypothetical protein
MIKEKLCSCALALAAALFSTGSLYAASLRSERVTIPFEFNVDRMVLPSGEYRIEQEGVTVFMTLVNVQTGHRVQLLRDEPSSQRGKVKLVFEVEGHSARLKFVS